MRRRDAVCFVGGAAFLVTMSAGLRPATVAATTIRYEEVKTWPALPAHVQLGEAAGVAVDSHDHVFVFHRPGRGFDPSATDPLKEAAVLEIDADTGQLIRSWGANMFLVPHGITIDPANNVFLTDVGLHQVFKFSHDGALAFAVGEPRVGKWDATHFNQPTDIAIRRDGSFYVSDGYVNSRVAIFDKNGRWLQEWGKKGAGDGEFSNPHGLTFVPGSTDVVVADRENSRLQLFDRLGAFKRHWVGVKDAQTTGRVFSVAADRGGCVVCRYPARGLRYGSHRRPEARSAVEDCCRRRLRQARRPRVQCRSRFGDRPRRVGLRRRNPDQTGHQAASGHRRLVVYVLAPRPRSGPLSR
jgi:peptidylamidoglycolate lyase